MICISTLSIRGPDEEYSKTLGVLDVVVGYAGGKKSYPTYNSIKDYTEAVRVNYQPGVVSYREILESFIKQLGGGPVSPSFSRQYRSAILYHNAEQKLIAEEVLTEVKKKRGRGVFIDVEPATDFYRGEEYHQKFYKKQRGRY